MMLQSPCQTACLSLILLVPMLLLVWSCHYSTHSDFRGGRTELDIEDSFGTHNCGGGG